MSLTDVFDIIKNGGPDAIFLLLFFSALWLTGRVFPKNTIDYRDAQIAYRDAIIERQDANFKRQQELFDLALKTIREDMLPLLERQSGGQRLGA